MNHQPALEICVKGIGYTLAGIAALLAVLIAQHIEPAAAGAAFTVGCILLSVAGIARLTGYLREVAGL